MHSTQGHVEPIYALYFLHVNPQTVRLMLTDNEKKLVEEINNSNSDENIKESVLNYLKLIPEWENAEEGKKKKLINTALLTFHSDKLPQKGITDPATIKACGKITIALNDFKDNMPGAIQPYNLEDFTNINSLPKNLNKLNIETQLEILEKIPPTVRIDIIGGYTFDPRCRQGGPRLGGRVGEFLRDLKEEGSFEKILTFIINNHPDFFGDGETLANIYVNLKKSGRASTLIKALSSGHIKEIFKYGGCKDLLMALKPMSEADRRTVVKGLEQNLYKIVTKETGYYGQMRSLLPEEFKTPVDIGSRGEHENISSRYKMVDRGSLTEKLKKYIENRNGLNLSFELLGLRAIVNGLAQAIGDKSFSKRTKLNAAAYAQSAHNNEDCTDVLFQRFDTLPDSSLFKSKLKNSYLLIGDHHSHQLLYIDFYGEKQTVSFNSQYNF